MVNVKVLNLHSLCSKFNIAWGGSERRRGEGEGDQFYLFLSAKRSQHF